MTALVLPLRGAADLELLAAIVRVSERLDSTAILDSDLATYATQYYWQQVGFKVQ